MWVSIMKADYDDGHEDQEKVGQQSWVALRHTLGAIIFNNLAYIVGHLYKSAPA